MPLGILCKLIAHTTTYKSSCCCKVHKIFLKMHLTEFSNNPIESFFSIYVQHKNVILKEIYKTVIENYSDL